MQKKFKQKVIVNFALEKSDKDFIENYAESKNITASELFRGFIKKIRRKSDENK